MRHIICPLAVALAIPSGLRAQQPAPAPADTAGAIELGQAEVRPEMKNLAEAQRLLAELYPPALRDAGVAGTAKVRFVLSAAGVPAAALVAESAGNAELDAAALRVVAAMRFEPAKRGGAPVPVWVTLPVSFVAAPSPAAAAEATPADSASVAEQLRRAVELEAVEQPPAFADADAVARLVESRYPRSLAAAGVGGTVTVRVVVDAWGRALAPWAHGSSGYAELDQAAVEVVRAIHFVPAFRGGAPQPVRVDLPVTFVPPDGVTAELGPDPADAPAAIRMEEADEPARVRDPQAITRALERLYPAPLRVAGVGGTATLRFVVDERGSPVAARVAVSSGNGELDRAALRVLEETRFEPARRGRERVAAWMNLPVPFTPKAAGRMAERLLLGSAPDSRGIYEMAQVDSVPELRNRSEVARGISRAYPRELRDAGVSGSVVLEAVVDREGNVTEVKPLYSTHPAFGEQAARVAAAMRFSPARLGGEAVPVRVVLPVTFGMVTDVQVETREIPSSPSWLPSDVRLVPFPRTTEGTRGNP